MRILTQILILAFHVAAQVIEPEFSHLTLEDGLSQSVILDIAQDSTGFLWFATQDGLNRYNGYDFLILKNNPDDSTTLTDNWITSLCVVNDSILYAGTQRGGLNKINLRTLIAEPVRLCPKNHYDEYQYVSKLYYDGDSLLIVGTWGKGLLVYNLLSRNIVHFTSQNSDLTNDRIRAIKKISDKEFLIGTANGLNRLDIETHKFNLLFDSKLKLTENFILSLATDNNNNWWIGTRRGLNIYLKDENKLIKFSSEEIGDKIIHDIFIDKNKYVWLATNKAGISKTTIPISDKNIDYEKIKFVNYKHSHSNPNSISGSYVRKIFQDKSEVLWFGTWGASISKLDAKPPKFFKVTPYNLLEGKLSSPLIRTFTRLGEELWIGTAEKGIDIFNTKTKKFRHIHPPEFTMNDEILSLFTYGKNVYIGTRAGLNIYSNGKIKLIKINRDLKEYPEIISISSIIKLNNNLLLGTTNGLVAYNLKSNKFYIPLTRTKIRAPYIFVNYLLKDSQNNVWVASKENFLYRFKIEERENKLEIISFSRLNNPYSRKYPGQNRINYVLEKNGGNLWLATSQGLLELNRRTNKITIYTQKNGLANDIVYALLEDNNGNLWASTNKGISKISFGEKITINNYYASDGLQSNEFIQASCFQWGDTLFFGGIKGYNYFIPDNIFNNPYPPGIILTEFKIANQEQPITYSLNSNKSLEVNYSDKIFTFVFAALEFTSPERNQYYYYLEGFDKKPVITNERKITYTNLDPGKYSLIVKAANNDGVWNSRPYKISLTVIPPFWLTWEFRIFIIVIFASFIAFIVRTRYKRLLETERLRTKIASDLHDDVGSMLTQISIYAELIGYEKSFEKAQNYGKFIAEKSRQIIGTMSDIIWSIDSRYDTVGDLIDRMREFGVQITQAKNIKFIFSENITEKNKTLTAEIRQNIFMIYKEAVNNAVKYAETQKINAELKKIKNELVLTITDYGKGVDINSLKRKSGIRNMEMRAKRIKGKIEFINENGLTIKLTVKI